MCHHHPAATWAFLIPNLSHLETKLTNPCIILLASLLPHSSETAVPPPTSYDPHPLPCTLTSFLHQLPLLHFPGVSSPWVFLSSPAASGELLVWTTDSIPLLLVCLLPTVAE